MKSKLAGLHMAAAFATITAGMSSAYSGGPSLPVTVLHGKYDDLAEKTKRQRRGRNSRRKAHAKAVGWKGAR